jgi:hypothetical protein
MSRFQPFALRRKVVSVPCSSPTFRRSRMTSRRSGVTTTRTCLRAPRAIASLITASSFANERLLVKVRQRSSQSGLMCQFSSRPPERASDLLKWGSASSACRGSRPAAGGHSRLAPRRWRCPLRSRGRRCEIIHHGQEPQAPGSRLACCRKNEKDRVPSQGLNLPLDARVLVRLCERWRPEAPSDPSSPQTRPCRPRPGS